MKAKEGKMLIDEYIDLYLEGAKFFKYYGRALSLTEADLKERAAAI